MTDRIDWDDRAIDQLRYTREVCRDRDEARHLQLVDERATVARLYPDRDRTGNVTAAPIDAPTLSLYRQNLIALGLDPDTGDTPPDLAA